MTKLCTGCPLNDRNNATWIHDDGLYQHYYCDECIDLDANGEQYRLDE